MARLNEAAPAAPAVASAAAANATTAIANGVQPATENVDALRRRFIRQNRDLAKANSTQSLKIRTLEIDVSKLLSENLELRNQILHLQNEVHSARTQASIGAVLKIKTELQDKIDELGWIVSSISENAPEERVERQKKPLEGNWRERQPLYELMRESQLPTIAEDKLYPRRTLGTNEIQAIRLSDQGSNESPDLGPPPIARFDYGEGDPVKNASPLGNKTSFGAEANVGADGDDLPSSLSMNLETRRKRKEGEPKLKIRRHSLLPHSPAKSENDGATSTIMRTGAKRKLADRETEREKDRGVRPPSASDFTFSRKPVSEDPKKNETADELSVQQSADRAVMPTKPVRKVLGDKSVNMSPQKAAPTSNRLEKEEKTDKPVLSRPPHGKEAGSMRRRRLSSIPVPAPQEDDEVQIISSVEIAPPPPTSTDVPPPQTPADALFFSPTPSEHSTIREVGRGDTPPPSDLSSLSTISVSTDGGGRPSRRARGGAVNYAEPSLISKMRRPDKKMVDAISGLQDHRRVMSSSGGDKSRKSIVAVKPEPVEEDDQSWKNLPLSSIPSASSPLTHKSGSDDLPSSPPPNISAPSSIASKELPTTSSATISALTAAGRKKRRESSTSISQDSQPLGTDIDSDLDIAAKKLAELDIYEFKETSSPLSLGSSSDSGKFAVPTVPARSKSSRRHSSVGKDFSNLNGGAGGSEGGIKGEGRSERAASRRRSMML